MSNTDTLPDADAHRQLLVGVPILALMLRYWSGRVRRLAECADGDLARQADRLAGALADTAAVADEMPSTGEEG